MIKTSRLILIGGTITAVVFLCIGAWYRILSRSPQAIPNIVQEQAAAQQTATPVSPVLHPDPPKLAGNVLVGVKTPTKYYLAADGKRYVFPDDTKTYDTWKSQLPAVKKVSQDELESYPLGGNVLYRPGTRLIRIATDTNIYAVAHGGVLRAVNEGNAALLFGKDWKSLVDLMQDYYFTNYTIGAPILSLQDYSIEGQLSSSMTIEQEKGI
ncbi:MAG: hypothetical protein NT003_02960 [Candidatus Magasanikbacteria bacterium]|nr:hypothetical protein [Candidatus Magasanikbacteria bacterium]